MSSENVPEHETNLQEDNGEAIRHLKDAVRSGQHWYKALLEAISLWKSPEEQYKGRHYRYLIDNEAFDWLLLAERLCEEIKGLAPEQEIEDLLFNDQPPVELPKDMFKKLISPAKYQAYLNYLYGVLVEEALVLAVCEDLRKERRNFGSATYDDDEIDKAFYRIYESSQDELLLQFRKEKKYTRRKTVNLDELKEFTYWLFKHRVKHSEKSRVASDTRKALLYMQKHMIKKKRTAG
jgi:hypothetical protein